MNNNSTYYLDSCIFLNYINAEPGKVEIVDSLLNEIEKQDDQIVTSTVSIVEVAHANYEKTNAQLNPDVNKQLDEMWLDPLITLVDLNDIIAISAKELIRYAIEQKWGKLSSKDAVHLASAKWINDTIHPVSHFFTFDNGLYKYGPIIGIQIEAPFVNQPTLPTA